MGFKLVNIDGRAALTDKDLYYDLETISNGLLSSNTDEVLFINFFIIRFLYIFSK